APGGRIRGGGSLRDGRLDLDATLEATDAARLGEVLRPALAAAGVEIPELALAGSLTARVRASGPPASPRITGTVTAARLSTDRLAVSDLSASVDLAGLPAAPRGEVHLEAAALAVPGASLAFTGVRADLAVRRGRAEG